MPTADAAPESVPVGARTTKLARTVTPIEAAPAFAATSAPLRPWLAPAAPTTPLTPAPDDIKLGDGAMTAVLIETQPRAAPAPPVATAPAFVSPDPRFAPPVAPDGPAATIALAAVVPVAGPVAGPPVTRVADSDDRSDPALPAPLAPTALAPAAPIDTAAAAAAPLDLRRETWPHTMIERIAAQVEAVRDAADALDTRIRVVPDALGAIDVSVRTEGDTVHVHFAAEQAQTRALLAEAQPRLAELAESRGLRLGGAGVDGGQNQAAQQQGQQQGQQPQQRQPAPQSAAPRPAPARAGREDAGGRIA